MDQTTEDTEDTENRSGWGERVRAFLNAGRGEHGGRAWNREGREEREGKPGGDKAGRTEMGALWSAPRPLACEVG